MQSESGKGEEVGESKKVTARDLVRSKIVTTMAPAHMLKWAQIRSTLLALFAILWFHHRLFASTKELIVFLVIGFMIAYALGRLSARDFNKQLQTQMETALAHFTGREDLFDLPLPGQTQ